MTTALNLLAAFAAGAAITATAFGIALAKLQTEATRLAAEAKQRRAESEQRTDELRDLQAQIREWIA